MTSKVEIISKEMIKPSSPTPPTLRTHKLSLLDQISPQLFIPFIFFYQNEFVDINITMRLKKSLSDVLTRFYPLAGRLKGNHSVCCNDAGVEFIEAQVHGYILSQVIETRKTEELREFLPVDHQASGIKGNDIVLAIKVSLFDGGGIAIGVCMSHKVGDGFSIAMFINAWATMAQGGDTNIVQPNFDLACRVFRPMYLLRWINPTLGITNYDKLQTKRFVFDKEKLDALTKSASKGSQVENPSRVETLSAFLWKHRIVKKDSSKKMFAAIHAVDMRSRMDPPLPNNTFGNLWTAALALSNPAKEAGSDDLVYRLRSAVRKIKSEYINKKLLKRIEFLKHAGKLVKMYLTGQDYCLFSSCWRFPVYEIDFGWGKPVWMCIATVPYKDMIIFVGTKCGEGIEASVNMLKDGNLFEACDIIISPSAA